MSDEYYSYYKQVISLEDIEAHVLAGNWAAKDIVIAINMMSQHCDFFGLSETASPFTSKGDFTNALVTANYLKRIGTDVQWTDRIAPYMPHLDQDQEY